MTAVLRLLRGEDLEHVSRSLGVTAATLTVWRDALLAAVRRRSRQNRPPARLGDDVARVGELHTSNDLWQLVVAVKAMPGLLRAFDQLEHHGERGPVRPSTARSTSRQKSHSCPSTDLFFKQ
jgi:hypothetical protein